MDGQFEIVEIALIVERFKAGMLDLPAVGSDRDKADVRHVPLAPIPFMELLQRLEALPEQLFVGVALEYAF